MHADISFGLIMTDDMEFVEGTYQLAGQEWQVFVFSPSSDVEEPQVLSETWPSGVSGVFAKWPRSKKLAKDVVLRVLSQHLGITDWREVHGPDSIQLR